jgi:hypothetical protein
MKEEEIKNDNKKKKTNEMEGNMWSPLPPYDSVF